MKRREFILASIRLRSRSCPPARASSDVGFQRLLALQQVFAEIVRTARRVNFLRDQEKADPTVVPWRSHRCEVKSRDGQATLCEDETSDGRDAETYAVLRF
jgi:hypothetical protein